MIGNRYECQCCGRVARIVGSYAEGANDHGYEYIFEGEIQHTRWISTAAAAIRFRPIGDDIVTLKQQLQDLTNR